MAFQAGGAHALDRALEAVAYAHEEMNRYPATATWEKPAKGDPIRMEKNVHRHRPRRRAGDRLQHLPDLELLARPVRLAGHRQRGRREAAPAGRAAAGDHRRRLPRGARRGRLRPEPGHPGDRARRRRPGQAAGDPARGEADRLHRRQRVRRVAGAERDPGDRLHREGRRQRGHPRLHRLLQGADRQPGLHAVPLLRPDVHHHPEPVRPGRRDRDRRGTQVLRGGRRRARDGDRPGCSATTPARSRSSAAS